MTTPYQKFINDHISCAIKPFTLNGASELNAENAYLIGIETRL
jgi:hypothetical protein